MLETPKASSTLPLLYARHSISKTIGNDVSKNLEDNELSSVMDNQQETKVRPSYGMHE